MEEQEEQEKCDITEREIGSGFVQPESVATYETPPKYPFNNILLSESGHSFELDDTPDSERIRLQHRSGTFIEMDPEGNQVHKVYGNGYEITIKDKNVLIEGCCSVTIKGDSVISVEGNKIEKVSGDYKLSVDGDFAVAVKGVASILTEKDMQLSAGSGKESSDGAIRFYSKDEVYFVSDVMVGGTLNADMLYAKLTVDAGLGVSAGPLGFVTLDGGVAVGFPFATPTVIESVNLVTAPIGAFSILTSILMTDQINTSIFNSHSHTDSVSGSTSPTNQSLI